MKGLALDYAFGFFLLLVFVGIASAIMISIFRQGEDKSSFVPVANATYLCEFLNGGEISYEDFKNVLYGFVTNQCFEFKGKAKERITFNDIQNFVRTISKERDVARVESCVSPEINTNTIYIGFDYVENKKISMASKRVLNNDILICLD